MYVGESVFGEEEKSANYNGLSLCEWATANAIGRNG